MKHLVAIVPVWYGGRERRPGEKFQASDHDAMILCAQDISGGPKARHDPAHATPLPALNEARKAVAEPPPEPAAPEPVTQEVQADPQPQAEEPAGDAPEGRRRYRRRDLRAEE